MLLSSRLTQAHNYVAGAPRCFWKNLPIILKCILIESWLWGDRNIDDVDRTMDEINEQTENMKQIQEALSTPIGGAADIDEVSNVLGFLHIIFSPFRFWDL